MIANARMCTCSSVYFLKKNIYICLINIIIKNTLKMLDYYLIQKKTTIELKINFF